MIDAYHGVRDGSFTLSTFVRAWSCEFSNKLIMRKEDKKKDKKRQGLNRCPSGWKFNPLPQDQTAIPIFHVFALLWLELVQLYHA